VERLNINGVHDFRQQLANHSGDLLRIVGSCSLDCEICIHFKWPNDAVEKPYSEQSVQRWVEFF
jgi:hypothetical protein